MGFTRVIRSKRSTHLKIETRDPIYIRLLLIAGAVSIPWTYIQIRTAPSTNEEADRQNCIRVGIRSAFPIIQVFGATSMTAWFRGQSAFVLSHKAKRTASNMLK
jgi:hypothetical protein